MAQLKFVNIAKYKGVSHPAHTPFEVDDADVASMVEQGAIVIVPPKEEQSTKVFLDEMKVDELKAYAASNNIDISKANKKADIVAAIRAAQCAEE